MRTRPQYFCRVWIEDGFYLIRVEYVKGRADWDPQIAVGHMTQALHPSEVEDMAKDLIATLVETADFDVVLMFTGGAKI